MGTYTEFLVAGYPLLNSKSFVLPEAMTVFRESDRNVSPRSLADRNRLVWGDAYDDAGEQIETAVQYICDTEVVIARLDVMGFTLERARQDFESGRDERLITYTDWAKEEGNDYGYKEEITLLQSLSFEAYLNALRQVIAEGITPYAIDDTDRPELSQHVRYILQNDEGYEITYFADDVRCLIRMACEVAPKPSKVVQDITDVIDSGYYETDEPVCQLAIDSLINGHLENSNRIVLTEGSSDAQILKASLALLYPELSDYYSFLDFGATRVPGGAGQLVSLIKGFAAAGIGNRIIGLFDNDSAARDARRSLDQVRLPSNIVVLAYPDLPLLQEYPTLGPSGLSCLNVNGLAASIELYLGVDILTGKDGSLTPIQWKGYLESVGSYQGEVTRKADLQAAFYEKLAQAGSSPSQRSEQDWSGIDAILQLVFSAFRLSPTA